MSFISIRFSFFGVFIVSNEKQWPVLMWFVSMLLDVIWHLGRKVASIYRTRIGMSRKDLILCGGVDQWTDCYYSVCS